MKKQINFLEPAIMFASDELSKQNFASLSILVTGFEDLRKSLVQEYYELIKKHFPKPLENILNIYAQLAAAGPVSEDDLIGAAQKSPEITLILKKIIGLWYLGKLDGINEDNFNPERHYEALGWKAVQAHPPGLTGGYFGYWHYPPEN